MPHVFPPILCSAGSIFRDDIFSPFHPGLYHHSRIPKTREKHMPGDSKPVGWTLREVRLLLITAVFSRIYRVRLMYPEQVSACSGFFLHFNQIANSLRAFPRLAEGARRHAAEDAAKDRSRGPARQTPELYPAQFSELSGVFLSLFRHRSVSN